MNDLIKNKCARKRESIYSDVARSIRFHCVCVYLWFLHFWKINMTPFIGCFHNTQIHRGNHPKVIVSESLADPGSPAGFKDITSRVHTPLHEFENQLVRGGVRFCFFFGGGDVGVELRLCPKFANDPPLPCHVRFPWSCACWDCSLYLWHLL